MTNANVLLSATWVALMLTYLLGDVLRIFAGEFEPGTIGGAQVPSIAYLGIAALMLIPIAMVLLALTLPAAANRWVNVGVAAFLILFNLAGLPTYPGAYDKFLIVVGLGINGLTVWIALRWL